MHIRDLRPRGAGVLLNHFVGLCLIVSAARRSNLGYVNIQEAVEAGEEGDYRQQGDGDFLWQSLQSWRNLSPCEETPLTRISEDALVGSVGYPPICEFNVTLNTNSSLIVKERTSFFQSHYDYYGKVCRLCDALLDNGLSEGLLKIKTLWIKQTTPQAGSEDANQLAITVPWYKRIFSMLSTSLLPVAAAAENQCSTQMDDGSQHPVPSSCYSNGTCATGYLQLLVDEFEPSSEFGKVRRLQLRGYNVTGLRKISIHFALYQESGPLGFQFVNITQNKDIKKMNLSSCNEDEKKCGNIALTGGIAHCFSDQVNYSLENDTNYISLRLNLKENGAHCADISKDESIVLIAEFLLYNEAIEANNTLKPCMVNHKYTKDIDDHIMNIWSINHLNCNQSIFSDNGFMIVSCSDPEQADCSQKCIPLYPCYDALKEKGTCDDGNNTLLNLACKGKEFDKVGDNTFESGDLETDDDGAVIVFVVPGIVAFVAIIVVAIIFVKYDVRIPGIFRRKVRVVESVDNPLSILCPSELRSSRRTKDGHEWKMNYDELEFKEPIGRGGSGEIWRCRWSNTDVAVKLISTPFPEVSSIKEDDSRIIEREIDILSGLRHPNIVQYLGACRTPHGWCLVMEYCRRGSLENMLYNHSEIELDIAKKIRLLVHIARGMAYLHSQTPCIIHRDLKPANLLVADDFTVKVCDLGLSYRITRSHVTRATTFFGTAAYMSPEYLRSQSFSEKMDIWSFGVTMLEIITRTRPHGDLREYAQVIARVLHEPIPAFPDPKNETELALKDLYEQCCSFIPRVAKPNQFTRS